MLCSRWMWRRLNTSSWVASLPGALTLTTIVALVDQLLLERHDHMYNAMVQRLTSAAAPAKQCLKQCLGFDARGWRWSLQHVEANWY
jgi:hypothetical protein